MSVDGGLDFEVFPESRVYDESTGRTEGSLECSGPLGRDVSNSLTPSLTCPPANNQHVFR